MSPLANVKPIKFVDLFCGLGGFRIAAEQVFGKSNLECVFSSDIDEEVQRVYEANFGERPQGDITQIQENEVPDHDILFGGFPCQAFSIIGDRRGFEEARGTLFFDIARILHAKRPKAFLLENVKQLETHDSGRTLDRILATLRGMGYQVEYKVLNALDFGVPQKRERIFFVGFREPHYFNWPTEVVPMTPLEKILEREVDPFYYASPEIRASRLAARKGKRKLEGFSIWHENKGGNVSAYPFSCAMRAGASYNYLLVNGERRLTEREMLRLQGFPDSYRVVCGYGATRKQAGNSVAIPCVAALLKAISQAKARPAESIIPSGKVPQSELPFSAAI